MDLRHTRREGRSWLPAPGLEWRANEATEEHKEVDGVDVPTSDMARSVAVLSLPWIRRGQRDGEEREERTRERGETTWGEGGV